MEWEIQPDEQKIVFAGECFITEIGPAVEEIKARLKELEKWEKIFLDLRKVEKADSSFIQLLLSFFKTYPDKIRFSFLPQELREILKLHGFKLVASSKS